MATTKGIDAGLVGDLMMQAVEYRFGRHAIAPSEIEWLSDNGSCYTAAETRSFASALESQAGDHTGFQSAEQRHGREPGQDHQARLR